MKKRLLAIACVIVMIFTLVACTKKEDGIGKWVPTLVKAGGGEYKVDGSSLEGGSLEICEDGTFILIGNDQTMEGTWTFDEGNHEFVLTLSDGSVELATIESKELTIEEENGVKIVFEKEK